MHAYGEIAVDFLASFGVLFRLSDFEVVHPPAIFGLAVLRRLSEGR